MKHQSQICDAPDEWAADTMAEMAGGAWRRKRLLVGLSRG
jgi:hypothetical protein